MKKHLISLLTFLTASCPQTASAGSTRVLEATQLQGMPTVTVLNGGATISFPSTTDTLLGRITTDTLSNKTLATGSNHITGTAARACQFNSSSSDLEASSTTNTELGYVAGVTSPIQTQLTARQIGPLTNEVTTSGAGSSSTTVVSVAGSLAANIHSAELLANAATSLNTANTIPKRDGSGNFVAGTITANLTGTASACTLAAAATALAANPTDCGSNTYATTIDASGNLTCASITNASTTGTAAATASTLMLRDSNANVQANNHIPGYATTVTAAGTTTLTVSSAYEEYFTGSTTQTVVLPDATTLPQTGFSFHIVNNSSGIVTVNKNGGTLVQTMAASSTALVTATNIGSSAGSWNSVYAVTSAGGGTVTSVGMTGDGVIFNSSVTGSPVSTSGTFAPSLVAQTAQTYFGGPRSGSAAPATFKLFLAPLDTKLSSTGSTTGYMFTISSGNATLNDTYTNNGHTYTVLATVTAGTQLFTSQASAPTASGTLTRASGSGDATITFSANQALATFTPQTNPPPLYIEVEGIGGGSGGTGGGATAGASLAGGVTAFGNTFFLVGNGGLAQSRGQAPAGGGTATIASLTGARAIQGGSGGGGGSDLSDNGGGMGCASPFGGAGGGSPANTTAGSAIANTGSGGGGGGTTGASFGGSGGNGGRYFKGTVTSPATIYYYTIGLGSSGGTAGTGGSAGGPSGSGVLFLREHFQ